MEENNVEQNVEAIEEEKQGYLAGHPKESGDAEQEEAQEEDIDAEETEFNLSGGEINEWIHGLMTLKENKGSVELEIDEEHVLKINYEEDSDESSEENIGE